MADIASARQKINDIEVSNDAPVTEDLFVKIGANINDYLDKGFRSQEFTSNGSWTCPTNVTRALLIGCGGGGGGAGDSGGGGSGAPLGVCSVTVVPTTVYSVTVGAGGSGGTTTHGSNGGDTIFGSLATFKGARGGIYKVVSSGVGDYIDLVYPNTLRRAPVGTLGGFYDLSSTGGVGHTYGQDSAQYSGGLTYAGSGGGCGGGAGPFGPGADGYSFSWWQGQSAGANSGAGGSAAGTTAGAQPGGAGGSGKLIVIWWGNS